MTGSFIMISLFVSACLFPFGAEAAHDEKFSVIFEAEDADLEFVNASAGSEPLLEGIASLGRIRSCPDGEACCICRMDNGFRCGNPDDPSDPSVRVDARDVPFEGILHFQYNPSFRQRPPPRKWNSDLCCEWADPSWGQLANAVGDDWWSGKCWGFTRNPPCKVNTQGAPIIRSDKSWSNLAVDVVSQIADSAIEFTSSQWHTLATKFHDLAIRMQRDPIGTLKELYDDAVSLVTLDNINRAWKVVKAVGNVAVVVVAVTCPACGAGLVIGSFVWSLAKCLINAILMYASGESGGAIAGKFTFDVATMGFMAGFGFDHDFALNLLKDNVWDGLDTMCTTLKLSKDVTKAAHAVNEPGKPPGQITDEDIILSKESLDLVDETGEFARMFANEGVKHLTCKQIEMTARKKGKKGPASKPPDYTVFSALQTRMNSASLLENSDAVARLRVNASTADELSCGEGMTVDMSLAYPIDAKVMNVPDSDWKAACARCGQYLENARELPGPGWYCESSILGVWLKMDQPRGWQSFALDSVPSVLRACQPLNGV